MGGLGVAWTSPASPRPCLLFGVCPARPYRGADTRSRSRHPCHAGNAKTGLNDNSSRFGKYLELRFDLNGGICGAHLSHYLLEKSRVTARNDGEQNFHSFYQLYAHLHATGKLGEHLLSKPSSHRYLQGSGSPSDSDVLGGRMKTCGNGMAAEWLALVDGLTTVGVKGELMNSMMRILSGILLLGDVDFKAGGHDSSRVTNQNVVANVCTMLALDATRLSKVLTCQDIVVNGETTTRPLNVSLAASTRDALAKMIYAKIFDWIFKMSNEFLSDPAASQDSPKIGVLDIFGFETFATNSIEQMFINLANEQLQWYFNNFIFVKEEEEYVREGIDLAKIEFVNNDATLDMFKNHLMVSLDEQSRFPKATDHTFLIKCKELSSHNSGAFTPARSDNDLTFKITHYAGEVEYDANGFLDKNRDKLSADVVHCLVNSKDKLLAMLFSGGLEATDTVGGSSGSIKKRSAKTVATVFKASLNELMDRMGRCKPYFVRCIKPNLKQKANLWDDELVMRQLRYAGVLETIRIRKLGYSFRMEFDEFVRQFKSVVYHYHEEVDANKEACLLIMQAIAQEQAKLSGSRASVIGYDFGGEAQIGKTKVFMKYYHADMLHVIKKKHAEALLFLQKIVRGHVAREMYKPLRQKARQQKVDVADLLKMCETNGANAHTMAKAKAAEDDTLNSTRPWLERVMQQAQLFETAQAEHAARRQSVLAGKLANPTSEKKTKAVGGYFVWERDEFYEDRVGPLEHPWRAKVDPTTDRTFFRNTIKKTTTWIDPRSLNCEDVRPHNPEKCLDDQLPFGWDRAETEGGDVFYVNHMDNSHHKDHPREELAEKIKQRDLLAAEAKVEITQKLEVVNDLKEKRALITRQAGHAPDTASRQKFEDRIHDLTTTISRGTRAVEDIRTKLKALDQIIDNMRAPKTKAVLSFE